MTTASRLTLLHLDDEVVAVDKPAGLAVIPTRTGAPGDCVAHHLSQQLGQRLWVIHRLDQDTSGVLVLARTAEAHRRLSMAFEAHQVHKTYWAITAGAPSPLCGVVDIPLHAGRKGRMRPARPDESGALASSTRYGTRACAITRHEMESSAQISWVEAHPLSGRQHQIRVHLRAVGAPLLVDRLYGPFDALEPGALGPGSPAQTRLTLHARSLELPLKNGGSLRLEAPPPDDLRRWIDWITREAPDASVQRPA